MSSTQYEPGFETAAPTTFRVCPSCHRWYRDASNPWWIDRCSECEDASRVRSERLLSTIATGETEHEQEPDRDA